MSLLHEFTTAFARGLGKIVGGAIACALIGAAIGAAAAWLTLSSSWILLGAGIGAAAGAALWVAIVMLLLDV